MKQTEKIFQAVLEGDLSAIQVEVQAELDSGGSAPDIIQNGLIAAMAEVGRILKRGSTMCPRCWLQRGR